MVSDRSLDVLRVIVQDYVASREPVGSKTIVERHSFGVSAATIRNDMALLEEEELIAAPHTSSGRVPTDKGYRVFVDQLTDVRPLTAAQRQAIETFLGQSVDLDDVLARTRACCPSSPTRSPSRSTRSFGSARVRHIELVAARGIPDHDGADHRHRPRRAAASRGAGRRGGQSGDDRVPRRVARPPERRAWRARRWRMRRPLARRSPRTSRRNASTASPRSRLPHRAGRRQPAGQLVMAGAANLVRTERTSREHLSRCSKPSRSRSS